MRHFLSAAAVLLLTPLFASAATPVVNNIIINYAVSPNQITVNGSGRRKAEPRQKWGWWLLLLMAVSLFFGFLLMGCAERQPASTDHHDIGVPIVECGLQRMGGTIREVCCDPWGQRCAWTAHH